MNKIISNSRWITLEGAFNVRDTGGYPASGGTTRPNALLRADSLHRLTNADRQLLMGYGLRTVIDLRHPGEISLAANVFANADDVTYHSLPIFEAQPDTAGADADLPTIYRYMVDHCQKGLLRALQAITHARAGATLIHCTAGKDRTGVVTALALEAVGVPRAHIVTDYALTTEGMKRLRPHLLGNAALPPEAAVRVEKLLGSDPELMLDLLSYLDAQYGGTSAYLDHIGFSSAERNQLHTRLVQPSHIQEIANV
jgi:protein-tyrosine phosphatase